MRKNLIRFAVVPGVVALTGAAIGFAATGASADTVTGGTMNITFSTSALSKYLTTQSLSNPFPMGTATVGAGQVQPNLGAGLDYSLEVTGGNANVAMDYGTVNADGGLELIDAKTQKAVTLNNIVFTVQDDTISAVPSDSPDGTPIVFFDVDGTHTFSAGQPETFTGDRLQLDPAGAQYLNSDLGTTFGSNVSAKIGSFVVSFTSTNP